MLRRSYLNQALKIFSEATYLVNELARTTFLKSRFEKLVGQDLQAEISAIEAFDLRRKILGGDARKLADVDERHYDELVAYWSR